MKVTVELDRQGFVGRPAWVELELGVQPPPANVWATILGTLAPIFGNTEQKNGWSLHLPSTPSTSRKCTPQVLVHFRMVHWPDTSRTRTNPNPGVWGDISLGGIPRTRS